MHSGSESRRRKEKSASIQTSHAKRKKVISSEHMRERADHERVRAGKGKRLRKKQKKRTQAAASPSKCALLVSEASMKPSALPLAHYALSFARAHIRIECSRALSSLLRRRRPLLSLSKLVEGRERRKCRRRRTSADLLAQPLVQSILRSVKRECRRVHLDSVEVVIHVFLVPELREEVIGVLGDVLHELLHRIRVPGITQRDGGRPSESRRRPCAVDRIRHPLDIA